MKAGTCPFPGCLSIAQHEPFDTHIRCSCGWTGIRFTSHVAGMTNVGQRFRYPGSSHVLPDAHKIVARQRLQRPILYAVPGSPARYASRPGPRPIPPVVARVGDH